MGWTARRTWRIAVWGAVSIGAALALAAVGARALFMASLPRESGEASVPGLSAPVEVDRDALGVPTIRAANLEDAARGLGFVHAQERFFQMDTMRRYAAGELAALVGRPALVNDRAMRARRFRAESRDVLSRLPDGHRRLMIAYGEGVNAGLADLRARPPEYFALGTKPEAWRQEDCLLVMFAMFDTLSLDGRMEKRVGVLRDALPREVADFLTPDCGRSDAPILTNGGPADGYCPTPIPGPDVIDLRAGPAAKSTTLAPVEPEGPALGSNNWAVAGSRTEDGRAILANDMHLRLAAPNVWFRAQLEWGDRRAVGVSLPGAPGIVAGSNGSVAWGYTNTTGDFQDNIIVDVDPDDSTRYRTPDGWDAFGEVVETIEVAGSAAETLRLKTTRWGVVSDKDHRGRLLVMKWTATEPDRVNMAILDMMEARTLEEGIALASAWRGPSQNVLIADSAGRIGWVVSGVLPKRTGFDGKAPASWAAQGVGWDGELDEAMRPTVVDPPGGALYTANNRTADAAVSRLYGDCWSPGDRAARIRDLIAAKTSHDEKSLMAIQEDARSEMLDFYRDLISELWTARADESDEALHRAYDAVKSWDGTTNTEQRGVALLEAFRSRLHARILGAITAPCLKIDPKFAYRWLQSEEPVRRILEERPAHLVPPGDADWLATMRAALGAAIESVRKRNPKSLAVGPVWQGIDPEWGEINRAAIRHPLTLAVPMLGRVLDMPRDPLSGHWSSVRVCGPVFGASERMAVSPGREDLGLFQMPTGQSGHFLSRHYADGHAAWVAGKPGGLLAGARVGGFRLRAAE